MRGHPGHLEFGPGSGPNRACSCDLEDAAGLTSFGTEDSSGMRRKPSCHSDQENESGCPNSISWKATSDTQVHCGTYEWHLPICSHKVNSNFGNLIP